MMTLQPMSIVQAAADLIWSPMLRKFPDLTFALSEGGIGWVPYFLERIDRVYQMHRAWTHQDFGDKLPSQVFLERIALCFIDDEFGIESRHKLNLDMVTWECDYPHSDSTWPLAPETLAIYLDGVPDNEVNKITHQNALQPLWLRHVQTRAQATSHRRRAARPGHRCRPRIPLLSTAEENRDRHHYGARHGDETAHRRQKLMHALNRVTAVAVSSRPAMDEEAAR